MPLFVKESLFYRLVSGIARTAVTAYENSLLKKAVCDPIARAWAESAVHKLLRRYADKKPAFENALCYRLVMAAASLADRLFAFINRLLFAALDGSAVWQGICGLRSLSARGIIFLLGLLFMSVGIGGAAGSFIIGKTNDSSILICVCVFAAGAVGVLCSVFYEKVINCGIARLIRWLSD